MQSDGAFLYIHKDALENVKDVFRRKRGILKVDASTLLQTKIPFAALLKTTPYFNHFVIEGGEPLFTKNLKTILTLIEKVKATRSDIKIWIYTGYTYEQLKERIKKNKDDYYLEPILRLADVLVDGPFIQEKKDLTLAFKGSSNQRVIDLQKTHAANDIMLLDI